MTFLTTNALECPLGAEIVEKLGEKYMQVPRIGVNEGKKDHQHFREEKDDKVLVQNARRKAKLLELRPPVKKVENH
jgi:hypothetical protein